MRYIITATVLAVATMAGVQAKPPSGGKGSSMKPTIAKNFDIKHSTLKKLDSKYSQVGSSKYSTQFGKKFSQGFFYSGKDHCHWSYCCYWPQYRCDCYYCPDACVWYYYCEPRQCYLPVSCIEHAPPVALARSTSTATAVSNVNVNVNSAPVDLPPVLSSGKALPVR